MEWTAHWDWDSNLPSKPIQTPKPNIYWGKEGEGDIDDDAAAASLNFSADCAVASAGSTSDISISASTHHSSSKEKLLLQEDEEEEEEEEVIKASHLTFGSTHCNTNKHCSIAELSATSSSLEGPSNELLIGLKLGKRTYFDNTTNAASFSVPLPVSSAATSKRIISPCPTSATPRCIVQGCNLDISSAKHYHRKHKICETHSKAPKVVVGGLERRFCQQCSRFHNLSEFDENKRSCRRRLSDHNARRRKPQQDTIQFNSSTLASSTFEGTRQISFILNCTTPRTKPAGNSILERTFRSKNTQAKGYLLKTEKAGVMDDLQSHLLGIQLPYAVSNHNSNMLLQCKGSSTEASNQDTGFNESMLSSNLDAAPDLHRALSLLSTNSWGSREYVHPNHSMNVSRSSMPQYVIHSVSQGLPNAPSECWQAEVQSSNAHMHAFAANSSSSSHYEEIQLLTSSYDSEFYSNLLN